jgi:hypothetical protein
MLDEDSTLPKKVYIPCALIETVNGLFKTADLAAGNPEHIEKLVPESPGFCPFTGFIFPFFGETDCTVLDFVPTKSHSELSSARLK